MLQDLEAGKGVAFQTCGIPNRQAETLRPLFADSMNPWVEKRRKEFLAGRWCVQQCYGKLGIETSLPGIQENRSPAWPKGVIGSISHCDDLALAVVALDHDVSLIGVDVESVRVMARMKAEICDAIATSTELEIVGKRVQREAMTLVFSAKETLYKALHPKVGQYFDYLDARVVSIDGTYTELELLKCLSEDFPASRRFLLQYRIIDHHVLTLLTETG